MRNAPAPWVPYTRAGCDVGGVGLANIELENNTAIVTRSSGNTTLGAASAAGATSITVASAANLAPGQTIILETGTVQAEVATITTIVRHDRQPRLPARERAQQWRGRDRVYRRPDRRHDEGLRRRNAGMDRGPRNSQIAPAGTAARNIAQTDFVGIAIHCGAGGGICNQDAANARPDPLPDEAGGYTGYQALFGAKYVNPAINNGNGCVNGIDGPADHGPVQPVRFPGL